MPFPKVTIVGAGHVGATTAHVLLLGGVCDVVLLDVVEGLAKGKALDLAHSRSVERFGPTIVGTSDYDATAGSDVVVVTAGVPRRPGMTREELLGINAGIVRSVMEQAVPPSPEAVFVIVTNPLDVMTHLAWRASGLPCERVIGMGGVLDSARFAYYISEETGEDISRVDAVCCGMHGEDMVPLPRHSTVGGRSLTEVLSADRVAEVVRRTVEGGAEVVGHLRDGSAYYAPAASIAATVRVLVDGGETLPTCVLLRGEYGIGDVHMSVPAVLGDGGVLDIPELDLEREELEALRASAAAIARMWSALEAGG